METTTNHLKASEFIKAFITSYSNEVLVDKVKTLYKLSEEDIQELINNESQTLDIFLDAKPKVEFQLNGDMANEFHESHMSDEDDDRFDDYGESHYL